MESERKLSGVCSLASELEAMKTFRMKLLESDKLLIQNELLHRTLASCAHTTDVNLRCEQLKQIRSTLEGRNTIFLLSVILIFVYLALLALLLPIYEFSHVVIFL